MSPAPGETQRCRVCGKDAPEDAARCPSCSAALGDLAPCPHCRATAGVSTDAELRLVCDVCGGPRVPVAKGFTPSGDENKHLRAANAARKARAGWRAGAVAAGLLAPMLSAFFLLLMVVFAVGFKLVAFSTFALVPVIAFLLYSISKSRARGREIAPAIDAAWVSIAGDLAKSGLGRLPPREVAKRLGIDEAQAEELSAIADVDAEVAGVPRQRVADAAEASSAAAAERATDAAALAEAEAELEAELSGRTAKR